MIYALLTIALVCSLAGNLKQLTQRRALTHRVAYLQTKELAALRRIDELNGELLVQAETLKDKFPGMRSW